MIPARDEDVALEPTTTRTGGRAARLAAVVTGLVLIAFVYVGLTGRDLSPTPPTDATASPLPAVAVTSPTPRTDVSGDRPAPLPPAVEHVAVDPDRHRPYQFVGTVLQVGGQGYIADLEQVGDGHYVAAYSIARPMPAGDASLELAEMTVTTSHDTWSSLGRWHIPLDPLLGYLSSAGNWLEDVQPPQPYEIDAPPLRQTGYRIEITTDSRPGYAMLSVDLRPGPLQPQFSDETYVVRAGSDSGSNRVVMTEIAAGHLRGALPLPEGNGRISFDVTRLFSPYPLFGYDLVWSWTMTGGELRAAARAAEPRIVHGESAPPQELSRHYPRLLQSGFTITVWVAPGRSGPRLVFHAVARPAGAAQASLVDRDWPLRQNKDDLAALFKRLVDPER